MSAMDAELRARTTPYDPIALVDIDLAVADRAKATYPRNVPDFVEPLSTSRRST